MNGNPGGGSGGASNPSGGSGGASNPSGGSGGASNPSGGSGGSGGRNGECVKDADCLTSTAKKVCVYKISDGCAATGSCQPKPTGPSCGAFTTYCGCLGPDVQVACSDPQGYAVAPVSGPKGQNACPLR